MNKSSRRDTVFYEYILPNLYKRNSVTFDDLRARLFIIYYHSYGQNVPYKKAYVGHKILLSNMHTSRVK